MDAVLAEREGFEPPIRLPVCRISSAVHSTALPPLRSLKCLHYLATAVKHFENENLLGPNLDQTGQASAF
jgi:hypothetical protein